MPSFWDRRKLRWRQWWQRPLKWWEHTLVFVAAVLYCGLIASVVAFFWGGLPLLPLQDFLFGLAKWAIPAAVAGGVLAFFFPKVMLCILYPFSIIGIGDVEVT